MTFNKLVIALAAAGFASGAYATNGMNMEGYGPIATGMGGASFAYDNGSAAMMNNPATLGLAADGSRLDVALGFLGPDVKVVGGQSSGGDSYYMPAAGWVKKQGNLSYGVGMFAQGGMGTEFAMGIDGMPERSELGVGRLIAPLAYNVNPDLVVGGSLDFVWAMLDMRMAMPMTNMAGMITDPGNGTIAGGMASLMGSGYENARLDFTDSNDFTGKAKGTGFAGKLGFTYKLSPTLTMGGTYHSKTSLGDLETSTSGASFIATDADGVNPNYTMPGKLIVRDFQWPETYGLGLAFQATPSLLVAADVKHIGWKDVMKNFTMTFASGGDAVTFQLPQNWDDQTVFSLGLAYKLTNALTLRAGANVSDNPIPDATMHYLFPAIEEDHYTVGFGYAFSPTSEVNFSLQHAPEVKQTNSTFGYTVSHAQTSWQLMYSQKF